MTPSERRVLDLCLGRARTVEELVAFDVGRGNRELVKGVVDRLLRKGALIVYGAGSHGDPHRYETRPERVTRRPLPPWKA